MHAEQVLRLVSLLSIGIYDCFPRRVVGIRSPGAITCALRRFWGKCFGLRVTIKSANPCSAQAQKGSSPGSGDMEGNGDKEITSAYSPSPLMIFPITEGRTRQRYNALLYSSMSSSVTNQTKLLSSTHRRIKTALGLPGRISGDLNPATPATITEVSTIPLGRLLFRSGKNCDLRQFRANRGRACFI